MADDHADLAALAEDIDTETTDILAADREIHLVFTFEFLDLVLVHQAVGDFLDHVRRHDLPVDGGGFALDLHVDGGAGTEEEV